MLLPFGILASSGGPTSAFEHLATASLSSAQASVTFNIAGLGTTYKHLQLRYLARTDYANIQSAGIRFNGDTGNNYAIHSLEGVGGAIYSSASTSRSDALVLVGGMPGTSVTSGVFEAGVLDMADVFSSTKHKTIKSIYGTVSPGQVTNVRLTSGLWMSTAVPTSFEIRPQQSNFAIGSRFSLYGIKG